MGEAKCLGENSTKGEERGEWETCFSGERGGAGGGGGGGGGGGWGSQGLPDWFPKPERGV